MTTSKPSLNIVSSALSMVLMVLLALGPFLHAHYGNSLRTGFHVDGIAQASSHTHSPLLASISHVTSSSEEESAALGMTPSHARQTLSESQASIDDGTPAWTFWVWAFAVLALARHGKPLGRSARNNEPVARSVFAPGMPTLAHAPPLRLI